MGRPAVIFLRSAAWDARHLATSLAVTGAALGDEVTLALFGEPLRAFVAGSFDDGAPALAAAARVPPLEATLAEARRDLGLRVVACDTAARVVGLEPATIVPPLDAVVSLTELWRLAQVGRALSV